MKETKAPKSGRIFFVVILTLVIAGIAATVLLANDKRNLRLLLDYIGHPEWLAAPKPDHVPVRVSKGIRLPAARITVPQRAFSALYVPEQTFGRQIRSDPKSLCEKLQEGGFGALVWNESASGSGGWECQASLDLPAREGSERHSSIFTSIRGNNEDRVTSFRFKLNVENPADANEIGRLGGSAATIFLEKVNWTNPETIVDNIAALKDFDIQQFGSRIQFKREFGETPRYNFIATQLPRRTAPGIADFYFDRSKWFPLPHDDDTAKISGMMAGENPEGMMPVPQDSTP